MIQNTKCLDVKVPCTVKDTLRESQLGQRERYQRLVSKARTQLNDTHQAKTNDKHNTAMLMQSLENLLTTAKQQQDQLAQDAKTLEETKRRPRHSPHRGQPIANKKRRVKPPLKPFQADSKSAW